MAVTLTVNDKVYQLEDIDPGTPLLWALRDTLGLDKSAAAEILGFVRNRTGSRATDIPCPHCVKPPR